MPTKALHQFPRGFLWGCATAAHQVEGQNSNDWTRWEETPGHIFQNQRSGNACEWWAGRYAEDFDRAADMNNNAQRVSVEWSRIEPQQGRWDEDALAHYRDMLKALQVRGMTPMVTLHHFTNPLWISDHDGWLWDETPVRFEAFVRKVVAALGDYCMLWCTFNEPNVYATGGYTFGIFPPGMKNRSAFRQVALNLLKGHAAAYHAIKELQPAAQVGQAEHIIGLRPSPPALINGQAVKLVDQSFNQVFVMAIRDGVLRLPGVRPIPVPEAKGTLDWIGLQYYRQYNVGFSLRHPESYFLVQTVPTDMPIGPKDWGGLAPDAVYDHIAWLWKTVKVPIYITESGVPDPDDTIRPGYLIRTVRSVWRAVNFNFAVRGFFFWSLIDNFEWAEGYDPRYNFGLYQVDFTTQKRTARQSARLYRDICGQNGLSSQSVDRYAPDLLDTLFPGESGQNNVKLKPIKRTEQGNWIE